MTQQHLVLHVHKASTDSLDLTTEIVAGREESLETVSKSAPRSDKCL